MNAQALIGAWDLLVLLSLFALTPRCWRRRQAKRARSGERRESVGRAVLVGTVAFFSTGGLALGLFPVALVASEATVAFQKMTRRMRNPR